MNDFARSFRSLQKSLAILVMSVLLAPLPAKAQENKVLFNRDVRPILATNCFACHGPEADHRKSGLRLDERSSAIESGVIAPGDVDSSELVMRIFSDDVDTQMPPAHLKKPLTSEEKNILKQWIAEGAVYEQHWAFVPPTKKPLPKNGSINPIDSFVLDQLSKNDLKFAKQADAFTLVRRVYLDLTGLPPTPQEAIAFALSSDSAAYQKMVNKLLASPRYGERWARPWLDLARYADTNGYEKDRPRNIWPYRDWVIRSLNADLPYDQFSIYQLAGDMLQDPTPDQIIATGFHRNTMLNEEGGIDPLEYRFNAMVDRVATTGTVWLGMTTGCAQCHTHKFDPITHTDYYRMMALLNNTSEPDYKIPQADFESKSNIIKSQIEELESKLAEKFAALDKDLEKSLSQWISETRNKAATWTIARPSSMNSNMPKLSLLDDGSIFSSGDITKRDEYEFTFDLTLFKKPLTAIRIEAIPDDRLPAQGQGRAFYEGPRGDFFLSEIDAWVDGASAEFSGASDGMSTTGGKDKTNFVLDGNGSSGWQPKNKKNQRLQLVVNLANSIDVDSGEKKLKIKLLFERHYAASLGRFRFSFTDKPDAMAVQIPEDVEKLIVHKSQNDWSDAELELVRRHFLRTTPVLAEARKPIEKLKKKLPKLYETLVMQERPADNPRATFRHHRGEYLSPKEKVDPGILKIFESVTPKDLRPTNRLEFANWLFSDANPLAARVAVNRAWREFFGAGLLRTDGDFGVQSELPTHPELLDWLAVEFKESGWSMKKLHRLIVMSKTYQQDSTGTKKLLQVDPENRMLARGPRLRMTGEMIRDAHLKSSGLLSAKMYGPGVRPPQPNSVTMLAYGNRKWNADTGENRFRRSIYTFAKRAAPFAAFTVFDGPTGESCTARRSRSNTPLQALTVLNDTMFLEMAQALARKTSEQKLGSPQAHVKFLFSQVLTRGPNPDELAALVSYFEKQKERFDYVGESKTEKLDAAKVAGQKDASSELAALTMVARVVMNLDEAITKR